MTAMMNQCALCSNTTLIAFQDQNWNMQVANLTSNGWSLTQLSLDPIKRTGFALQHFYINNSEDQINLYHQKSNNDIALASRRPGADKAGRKNLYFNILVFHLTFKTVYPWSVDEQIYNTAAPGAPIAAANSYTRV